MRFLQGVLLLVFLGGVFLFALQNNRAVSVRFLGWESTPPVSLLILGVYVLGMLTGGTVVSLLRRSIRKVSEHPR